MASLFDNRTVMIGLALAVLWYVFAHKNVEGMDAEMVPATPTAQIAQAQQGYSETVAVASAAPTASVPAAPLTAVLSENLLAAVPAGMNDMPMAESPFTAEGTNYDDIFAQHDDLDPAELIPKDLPGDIYGEFNKPDPTLAGNLLLQSYSLGIDTSAAKRSWVSDVRKVYPIPQAVVSPWMNSTKVPADTSRRSLADIE